MASGKQYRAKFFNVSGVYITDLPVSLTGFRKIINGGLGDLKLEVPIPFEQAYENAATTIMNQVQVYVDNFLLYSGFVAGITPRVSANYNDVILTCRGHASRFATLPLKNSTTTWLYTDTTNGLKTTASATAASLDKIFKAIIDRYQAEAVYPIINYSGTSIVASSNTFTYIYQTKSLQYSIDTTMDNAPFDWYWRVGADNLFRFQQQSTTPDVLLNFHTQISSFEDAQLVDGMVNRRYFAYNGTPAASAKLTSDTTSSDLYGDWWDFNNDSNYTDATQVGVASQAIIDAHKNPVRRAVIEVPDSNYDKTTGYDIELLEPGMTVGLTNVPDAMAAVLPSSFTIAAVDYAPDSARLELNTYLDDIARELARSEALTQAANTDDTPATYS